jgi:hypothetical protein
MNECGYVRLHRKSPTCWQWSNNEWWKAWSWMMLEANWADDPVTGLKRGQLFFCTQMITEVCGMNRDKVLRFMRKAEIEQDISWERGSGGRPRSPKKTVARATQSATQTATQNASQCATVCATVLSVVTILNYNYYNPLPNSVATQCAPQSATVCAPQKTPHSATSKKRSKEVQEKNLLSTPIKSGVDREGEQPTTKRKPGPKPKEKAEPDPRLKRVIDYYHNRHIEVKGYKPMIYGAKDASLMKEILRICETEEETMARIGRFLNDDLAWMKDPSWEISKLYNRLNKYASPLNDLVIL